MRTNYKLELCEQDGNFYVTRLYVKYGAQDERMNKTVLLYQSQAKTQEEAIGKLFLMAYDEGIVLPFDLVENNECMNV